MNWGDILIQIISYASMAVTTWTSFREGFLFRSGEYDVHNEGSSIYETDEAKKKREAEGQAEGATVGEEGEVVSNAESYIKKINSYVPGLGTAIDIIFSPNFAMMLGLAGIALSFFTPLGPIVGGVTVGLGAAYMVVGLVLGTIGEKSRQIDKQITTVVKELEKDLQGIAKVQDKIAALNAANGIQGVNMNEVFSNMYAYQGHLGSLKGQQQTTEAYSLWTAPLGGLIVRFPMNAFMLATGIATLNPMVIGMGVGMLLFGEASAIRTDQRNGKIMASHAENMAAIRSGIGLPDLEGEGGLKAYAALLSETKRARMAMERFGDDYEKIIGSMRANNITPTNENLRSVFQNEYLAKQPAVSIPAHIPGMLECFFSSINNGFTWSKSVSTRSPLVPEFQDMYNDNAYKYMAVKERVRTKQPGLDGEQLTAEVAKEAKKGMEIEPVEVDKAIRKLAERQEQKDPGYWQSIAERPKESALSK